MLLLRYHIYMLKAEIGQYTSHRDVSGTVKWCVYYPEIIGYPFDSTVIKTYTTHGSYIFIIHIISDDMKEIPYPCLCLVHQFYL